MIKYINLYIVIKLTDLIIPVTHWVILSEIKGKLFQLISRLAAGSCRDVDHAEQVATIGDIVEPFRGLRRLGSVVIIRLRRVSTDCTLLRINTNAF